MKRINLFPLLIILALCSLALATSKKQGGGGGGHNPNNGGPGTGGGFPGGPGGPGVGPGRCPVPTPEMINCVRQWACQYIIRLDLRCLLNLNGTPLLGGLLGQNALSSPTGSTGTGGANGILGGLLGL